MPRRRKMLTLNEVSVLHAVAGGRPYGFDIMDATGLPSGSVYPILGRLKRDDLVAARWERADVARRDKRPPRRYYEITEHGRTVLGEAVVHYRSVGGMIPVQGMAAVPVEAES